LFGSKPKPKSEPVANPSAPVAAKIVVPDKLVGRRDSSDDSEGDSDGDSSDDDLFGSTSKSGSVEKSEPPVNTTHAVEKVEVPPSPLSSGVIEEPLSSKDVVSASVCESVADEGTEEGSGSSTVSPPSSSPNVSKRMSGALAKRMGGLDASKIIMPGMAPPPKFAQSARDRADSSETNGPRNRAGSSEPGEIVNVTLERATVSTKKGRTRKAPSRKKVDMSESHNNDPLSSASSIFTTDNVSGDLLGSEQEPHVETQNVATANTVLKTTPSPVAAKAAASSKAASSGLFGGDDDSDDDLFGSKSKPKSEPVAKSKATSSLFGDDDDLFGKEKSSGKGLFD
jgi:hypothetical protein